MAQVGECRTDFMILNELAKRLGFGDKMFSSEDAYFDFLLAPSHWPGENNVNIIMDNQRIEGG